ncbi:sensor histidine kinase [Paenibacillus eucommiae]|uniref:histidine kinase n=1 Tax=Paenibacillus eucommiae TaxID=1355755 RepID=A0ABS4J0R2_9BACL|nr:histidine kinase [Paenibacillus eucommiae]MBP1993411.1 sensor histidine kinase YesM [Paenibacillus eucommiae]
MKLSLLRLLQTRRFPLHTILIALSLVAVAVSLSIISILLLGSTKSLITEKLDVIHTTKFNQIASDIEAFFDDSRKIAVYLENNPFLAENIRKLENNEGNSFEKHERMLSINKFLLNLTQYNENIKSINIVTEKDQYYSGGVLFTYDLARILGSNQVVDLKLKYPDTIFRPTTTVRKTGMTFAKHLTGEVYYASSLRRGSMVYGNLYILLRDDFLAGRIAELDTMMIVDETGHTVYKGKRYEEMESKITSQLIIPSINKPIVYTDKNVQIYARQLNVQKWTLFHSVDLNTYREQSDLLRSLAVISFLISLVITFAFARFISKRILRPAAKLAGVVKRYHVGDAATVRFSQDSPKRKFSLREKVFYYLLITIMLPICCFVALFYMQSSSIITKQTTDAYQTVLQKAADNLSIVMDKKEKLLLGISYSEIAHNLLQTQTESDTAALFDMIEQYVYLGLDNDIYSLYDNNNKLIVSSGFRQAQQLDEELAAQLEQMSRGIVWTMDKDRVNTDIVRLSMPVNSLKIGKRLGYALVEMKYDDFKKKFSDLDAGSGDMFILKDDGLEKGMSGNHEQQGEEAWKVDLAAAIDGNSGNRKVDIAGAEHLFFYEQAGSKSWYLASVFANSAIARQSSAAIFNNIYLLVVLLLSILLLAFYMSWTLMRPINRINDMLNISSLEHLERIPDDYYFIDEIHELGSNFNRMIGRIEDLIDDLLMANLKQHEVEIDKKTAEIHALQAQINPHFLQNTLDNTIYMIKENHKDQAVEMIKSLSSLFRYGISRGETIIPVHEELKYAKAYVSIVNLRYRGKIKFYWEVEDSLLNYRTLKLILQPIIENAINHGIRDTSEAGTVRIECKDIGEHLQFSVADNGKGISEEKLAELRNSLISGQHSDRIGICNVQSRIRLYFGDEFGVGISSISNKGTTVTLTIPKISP